MKKILLIIAVLAVCVGLSSCDMFMKGGEVKVVNNTTSPHNVIFYFNSQSVKVRDSYNNTIQPGSSISAKSSSDTTWAVTIDGQSVDFGRLEGGGTVTVYCGDYF